MSKPIFVDPVLDGAADPTVIWNRERGEWWMFYTNRRAHFDGSGVAWIHGSPIGVANSPDGWTWTYRGNVAGLDAPGDSGLNTQWAPEVIFAEGEYHMFLTYFPGAPESFLNVARNIVHLTSPDLESWTRREVLALTSHRVIDAAVALCPDGLYRLWYKDEEHGSGTFAATSATLFDWQVEGVVIPGKPEGNPHEGPNVFELGGFFWMIVDEWRGQAVYRSTDARAWTRQGLILGEPGADAEDKRFARHADVVVQDGWAALYYFTHPGWDEAAKSAPVTGAERRTVIHAARLTVADGVLLAERDVERFALRAPQ